jgi:putative Mn2+ efflux pump MntP
MDAQNLSLLATAIGTAVLHTAIPDHWLPFVLIGRSRDWSVWRTARLTALAGIIHLVVSFGLAILALSLGKAVGSRLGEGLEQAAGPLLIAFGVIYAIWSWRKGGHFHPGGSLLHGKDGGCDGHEGDLNDEHLHYHADEGLIRDRSRWSGIWLAFLVGLNPCVLIVPVAIGAAPYGTATVAAVFAAYGVASLVLMVGLAAIGTRLTQLLVPGIARHMEWASGLLIALLGVVIWFYGHH